MRIREMRRTGRASFTLIELLVVIAIIAVLAGLTLAAVMHFMNKPVEVRVRNDFSQMEGAIEEYKTKTGATYIPSQLKLCKIYKPGSKNNYDLTNPLDHDSVDYIEKYIGKNSSTFMTTWKTTGILWAGANTPDMEILEGHQCLVFFLGGIQTSNGTTYACQGFGSDVAHPDNVTSSPVDNRGPYFKFDSARLSPPAGRHYCAYADPFGIRADGQVRYYAYFSSYKQSGGYNRYRIDGSLSSSASTLPVISDCASLAVWPYADTPAAPAVAATTTSPGSPATKIMFVKPDSFQIICSGKDGTFGPGTNLSGATGVVPYYWNKNTAAQIPGGGPDDLANFAFGKLQYGE